MPTTDTPSNGFLAIIAGIIGIVFDVPAPVVFAGFLGTWVGLVIAPPVTFLVGAGYLLGGTVCASFLTPVLLTVIGDYPARGVAFGMAVLVVGFKDIIIRAIEHRLGKDVASARLPEKAPRIDKTEEQ